eukprot:TRINITY_DN74552_c0_g1_i1.p1 TRINITY_DN74552_c0_g1~~TRINITY_DN74552_c0_g1_i1.p1  ORF type:complete len:143 (+),score=25.29 TRINITY_DN74552_c0_g1_i1:147-575(+)
MKQLQATLQMQQARIQATQDQLQQALDALNRLQNERQQDFGRMAELRDQLAGKSRSSVDTKGVGKPNSFDGSDGKKFPLFAFKFMNYIEALYPGSRVAMTYARDSEALWTQIMTSFGATLMTLRAFQRICMLFCLHSWMARH